MSATLFALGVLGWIVAVTFAAMSLVLWRGLELQQHENEDLIATVAAMKEGWR